MAKASGQGMWVIPRDDSRVPQYWNLGEGIWRIQMPDGKIFRYQYGEMVETR